MSKQNDKIDVVDILSYCTKKGNADESYFTPSCVEYITIFKDIIKVITVNASVDLKRDEPTIRMLKKYFNFISDPHPDEKKAQKEGADSE